MRNKKSLTGRYLAGTLTIDVPAERRKGNGNSITVRGCREHNLTGRSSRQQQYFHSSPPSPQRARSAGTLAPKAG